MTRLARVVGLGLLALGLTASVGWRHDGTAVRSGTTAPTDWSDARRVWRTPLSTWSNASPVPFGDQVVVLAEPHTIVALDAASGAVRWKVANPYVDTLPAAERGPFQARVDALPGYQQALQEAVAEVGRLRRLSRTAEAGPDTAQRIQAFTAVTDALRGQIDALTPYLTPADKDIIGYSSPTPVTDGARLYALFGHGVVSAVDLRGRRAWTTWVGAPLTPMRGYEFGSSASPALADGVLIVAHRHLQGLDPATGRVLWRGPEWRHYGAPAIVTVGGVAFALAPDGRVYRARDGQEVARDLADLWYTGPAAVGDVGYWVGGFGHESQAPTKAVAWRFAPDGAGGVTPTQLWSRTVASGRRVYATPVVADGLLYLADKQGDLFVLDAATGADVTQATLATELRGTVFANPQVVGGALVLSAESGNVLFGTTGRTWSLLGKASIGETSRSTPLFMSDRVYVRSATGVSCFR